MDRLPLTVVFSGACQCPFKGTWEPPRATLSSRKEGKSGNRPHTSRDLDARRVGTLLYYCEVLIGQWYVDYGNQVVNMAVFPFAISGFLTQISHDDKESLGKMGFLKKKSAFGGGITTRKLLFTDTKARRRCLYCSLVTPEPCHFLRPTFFPVKECT